MFFRQPGTAHTWPDTRVRLASTLLLCSFPESVWLPNPLHFTSGMLWPCPPSGHVALGQDDVLTLAWPLRKKLGLLCQVSPTLLPTWHLWLPTTFSTFTLLGSVWPGSCSPPGPRRGPGPALGPSQAWEHQEGATASGKCRSLRGGPVRGLAGQWERWDQGQRSQVPWAGIFSSEDRWEAVLPQVEKVREAGERREGGCSWWRRREVRGGLEYGSSGIPGKQN